jgi:hypothetical protein
MPSKSSKPPPDITAEREKEIHRTLRDSEEAGQRMDAKIRKVDELIQVRAQRAAGQPRFPVDASKVPNLASRFNASMVAMAKELAQARSARAARRHGPCTFDGGDQSRLAYVAHLVRELRLDAEDFAHEARQLGAEAGRWEREAMSAVRAGDDLRAYVALWHRRMCLDSKKMLRREAKLMRRLCGEYRGILRALRPIADT